MLLGKYAAENVPKMTDSQLAEYEALLNQETISIFKYVSGQLPLPEELNNATVHSLIEFAKQSPLGKADPAAYAAAKKFYSN